MKIIFIFKCSVGIPPTRGLCHRELILILLAAARLAIATNWKTQSAPTLATWLDKVWEQFLMRKITDSLKQAEACNYQSKFVAAWFPVLQYISELDKATLNE